MALYSKEIQKTKNKVRVRIAYLAEQTRIATVSKSTNPKILHEKPNENEEHMQTHVIFRWSSKKSPGPDTLKTAIQTPGEAVLMRS